MYGNGTNDPLLVEGLKEVSQLLPTVNLDATSVKKVLKGSAKFLATLVPSSEQTAAAMEGQGEMPCEPAVSSGC